MRFMVIVKASKESEAGILPSAELISAMGNYNEELVQAGVMLSGDGLQASSKGARVKFSGAKRTVVDGPFAETKELIAGFGCGSASHCRRRSTGRSVVRIRTARKANWRFARCLKPKTSAKTSHPSCANRKSGCGRSFQRTYELKASFATDRAQMDTDKFQFSFLSVFICAPSVANFLAVDWVDSQSTIR